ncbi:hypothetical protein [Streptomyces sp. NBC_01233]|uniref:hypothetical protein n=1 Tax=Streptomyces sp. NBC_01233 TaxID=2903787 RepID=UPI002E1179CE|nr:hypothetical protein OG332_35040 [Streptomyces sp. NBC_01233]
MPGLSRAFGEVDSDSTPKKRLETAGSVLAPTITRDMERCRIRVARSAGGPSVSAYRRSSCQRRAGSAGTSKYRLE